MAGTVTPTTWWTRRHRLLLWAHLLAGVAEGISLVVVPLPLGLHLALLVGIHMAITAAGLRVWPP